MGATMTITGANFSTTPSENIVTLNNLTAVVLNATCTTLRVTVPEGATTGNISITINGLTATSNLGFSVVDFTDRLLTRGLYVQFEDRGWPSGYW